MSTQQSSQNPRRLGSGHLGVALGATALVVALGVPSEAAKLIHGKNLKNNTVTSQKIKNDNLTGRDLKNGSVTGADIKESTLTGLLRTGDVAAYGDGTADWIDNFTAGAFTALVSTTFSVPDDGVLHVTGSLSAEDDFSLDGLGRLGYRLSLDGTGLWPGADSHQLAYAGAGEGDSGAVTSVVPVTAGEHTVSLDARELGTGSFLYGREISVIYVPTGAGFAPATRPTPGGQQGQQGQQPG